MPATMKEVAATVEKQSADIIRCWNALTDEEHQQSEHSGERDRHGDVAGTGAPGSVFAVANLTVTP